MSVVSNRLELEHIFSTIGFGDIVPGASLSADDSSGAAASEPGSGGLQSLAGNTQGPDSIGKKINFRLRLKNGMRFRSYQVCKLKLGLRELTSCLCSAAALAVCFEGHVAGLNATETGNKLSQHTFEFPSLAWLLFKIKQRFSY